MDWKRMFLTAQGRVGQRDFWLGFLVLFVANLVLGLIPILGQLISIALIYPSVCLFAQRLHDFGKSGWLAAVPYAAGLVIGILMFMVGGAAMMGAGLSGDDASAGAAAIGGVMGAGLLALVSIALGIGYLLWVGLSKGDPAANRYGPPPEKLVTAL